MADAFRAYFLTHARGVPDAARPQGLILPALTFHDRFAAQYPHLIAPDATT
jgi:hypothetical protein